MSIRKVELFGGTQLLISDRRGPQRGVYVLTYGGDPNASWARHDLGGENAEVMFVSTGSVFGGMPDVAVAMKDAGIGIISVMMWSGHPVHGAVPQPTWPTNSGTGKGTAIGDLDGDGKTEIVVTCEHAEDKHGVFYYTRVSDKEWAFRDISGLEGTKFDRIELLDVDGDGDLDVITCEERENLGVIWYENTLGTP
jgi:hypothetical protein